MAINCWSAGVESQVVDDGRSADWTLLQQFPAAQACHIVSALQVDAVVGLLIADYASIPILLPILPPLLSLYHIVYVPAQCLPLAAYSRMGMGGFHVLEGGPVYVEYQLSPAYLYACPIAHFYVAVVAVTAWVLLLIIIWNTIRQSQFYPYFSVCLCATVSPF